MGTSRLFARQMRGIVRCPALTGGLVFVVALFLASTAGADYVGRSAGSEAGPTQGMSIMQQEVPSITRTLRVQPVQLLARGTGLLLPRGRDSNTELQILRTEQQSASALRTSKPAATAKAVEQPAAAVPSSGPSKAAELPLLSSVQRLAAGHVSTLSTPEARILSLDHAAAATPRTAKPAVVPLLRSLERLAAGLASTLASPEAGMLMSSSDASSLDAEVAAVAAGFAAANLKAGKEHKTSIEEPHQRILAAAQQGRPAAAGAAAAKPPAKPAHIAGKPAAKPAAEPAAAKPAATKPAQLRETAKHHGSARTSGVNIASARIAQQQPVYGEDYTPGDDSGVFLGPDAPLPAAAAASVPASPSQPQGSTTPLYVTPQASFESLTEVNLDQPLLQIPQSFLGISHEWTHVEEINNIPGYKDIIRLLTSYGSGPFNIRVGGGSTDKQAYVFPQYVYDALRQVHEETGAQYIMSVNFEEGDVELARAQLKMAKDNLPAEAIVATEIGNEPNFYEGTQRNMTALQYVRCCFVSDWAAMARALACPCGTSDCCEYGQFAGPVWGHVNVFPTTLKWFLDVSNRFVRMTTVHWYKATRETYNTPVTLLEEAPMRKEMDNLRALVQTSKGYGIPLRVAESNTISNSGRVGVSNVFAATLWTLDGSFEVAATGAVGINFHQGSGQNLYTSILRWYNNNQLSPPVLRPPFYGMVMFQQAVGAGSQLLGQTQISGDASDFKVWPLMDVNTSELRFVLLNKHPSRAGTQVIRINHGGGYNAPAVVTRLVARGEDPLSATSGITLGGYYYAVGGVQMGADASEIVPDGKDASGFTRWEVYMPPGSAALVRMQLVNQ
ncbi:hypothetical protein COO60DRAFT_1698710 [Scenedesmus sp. NREL 46B-D3]|nr:hypothetical protein COO60DRAFT_1698710 [Scenedesmus sp. NREL 46B-D3]